MGTEGVCLAPEGSQSSLHLPGVGVRVRVGHQSSGVGGPAHCLRGDTGSFLIFPLNSFTAQLNLPRRLTGMETQARGRRWVSE